MDILFELKECFPICIIVLSPKTKESQLKVLFFGKLLQIFLGILLGISFVIIFVFSKAKES